MASISANTLFHFTSDDNLLGILSDEFIPRYCVEWQFYRERPMRRAIPMVCFCDIPLSQIGKHMRYYGRYGIGMKKSWAMEHRLNPVLYMERRSALAHTFDKLLAENFSRMGNPEEVDTKIRDAAVYLMSYIKPYSGDQVRNGKTERRRFYDEREWRFVPTSRIDGQEIQLTDELITPERLESRNQLLREYKLGFDPWHIQYIIISKESERPVFIHRIKAIKSRHYGQSKIELLVSKIISAQQIAGDL